VTWCLCFNKILIPSWITWVKVSTSKNINIGEATKANDLTKDMVISKTYSSGVMMKLVLQQTVWTSIAGEAHHTRHACGIHTLQWLHVINGSTNASHLLTNNTTQNLARNLSTIVRLYGISDQLCMRMMLVLYS
jgi:hypothetical protein